MAGKKKALIILLPIVAIAAVLIVRQVRERASSDPNVIRVSGNIEATDARLGFKLAGIVEARFVSEGERVEAGTLIARLESADLRAEVELKKAEARSAQSVLEELEAGTREEEVAQAAAAVAAARASLDELLAGSRPQEIAAAEATMESARVTAEHLRAEFERQERLFRNEVISDRELDRARSEYDRAGAQLDEAREKLALIREGPRAERIEQAQAALAEAEQRHAMLVKGPREETIEQARAKLEQAQAALRLVEIKLKYAEISSPLSGVVLSENIEPGEFVSPGTPVVTVGDLENVWLRAYIAQTDLGKVKLGQEVRITTDTWPDKVYNGRISFISDEAEFTPKQIQTEKERVKLVYRVKITAPNPDMELKPGMPADGEIILAGVE